MGYSPCVEANSNSSTKKVPPTSFQKPGPFSSVSGAFTLAHLAIKHREEYLAPIPESDRHDMILAYHSQLNSIDETIKHRAAKAWSKWE